jgi:hypothetical protein
MGGQVAVQTLYLIFASSIPRPQAVRAGFVTWASFLVLLLLSNHRLSTSLAGVVIVRGSKVKLSLAAKIAAFCRELGDDSPDNLRATACAHDMERLFRRAEDAVQSGQLSPGLEAELDSLDQMVQDAEGQGLYPAVTRGYTPLPWNGDGSGAQWWTCPQNLCAGRGRVQARQRPPVCAATSDELVPGPFPE